jgi:hypothetical protein
MAPVASAAAADYKDPAALIAKLKDAKLSLADGITQAEQKYGFATSGKFEMKGDKLMLSVYTAKDGRDKDAEHNVLMELLGDATKTPWTFETEVFEDRPHIARSAMHLSFMQTSKLSLVDVIKKAEAAEKGAVYSANPGMRKGMPVVDVLVATPDAKSVHLVVDLRTGSVSK